MTYNLNLVPGKVPVAVHVKQYDTAPREVTFNLYYGDAVYTIPSSVTITVSGTKPDGNGFAYNVTDFSGLTVTVPMQEQMTVLAGEIPCQLTIAQTSGVIGTATFTLCVEPAALSSDTPVSDTELAAFQQMLTQTQQEAAGVAGATAQIATNASNIAANAAAISSLNSNLALKSGNISVTSGWTVQDGNNWCRKSGHVAEFYLEVTGGTLASGWNNLGTLPSGFTPLFSVNIVGIDNGTSGVPACQVQVSSAGEISVYKTSVLTNKLRIFGVYLVA